MLVRRTKANFYQALQTGSIVIGAFFISKFLFWLAGVLLPVSFLKVPSIIPAITQSNIFDSLRNAVLETLKIFNSNFLSGPHNFNSISRLLNFIVLSAIVVLISAMLGRKKNPHFPRGILLGILVLMYVVYIASGQALQIDTSRYLIMLPLLCLIIVAIWGEQYFLRHKATVQLSWLGIILINFCLLLGALYVTFPNRYAKETYTAQIQNFMRQNNFSYAITSREFALPTNYYADRRLFILPVLCTPNHELRRTYLFYDKASYEKLSAYSGEVPLLLQGNKLSQGSTCSKEDILRQMGRPLKQSTVPGLGEVLIYEARSLSLQE